MIGPSSVEAMHLAYLDPASGGIIVQAIVAGVAGLFVFLKYQGRRVLRFFGLQKGRVPEAPEDDEPDDREQG